MSEQEYGWIYLIRDKEFGKCYVGLTFNLEKRWYQHKQKIKNKTHLNQHINNFVIKNNKKISDFNFTVIEKSAPKARIGQREKYWVRYFDSYKRGFNNTLGGEHHSFSGEKNGNSKLTRKQVIDIVNSYIFGDKLSIHQLAIKYKVGQRTILDILSGETWREIVTKEQLIKIKKQTKVNKEINDKIKSKITVKFANEARKRKVINLSDGKTFNSISEASRFYGYANASGFFNRIRTNVAMYLEDYKRLQKEDIDTT